MSGTTLEGTKEIDGSILKWLEDYGQRIVGFTLSEAKQFVDVEECCDNYFTVSLSKAEFGKMIAELQALHAQMVD